MIKQSYLIFILSLFIFISCQNSIIFEKYDEIPDYEWKYENKISFQISIKDTSIYHNLYLNLRHTGNYPFSNIWIMIYQKNPDKKISFKRYEFTLAVVDGKWLGKGLGDIVDHKIIFAENIKFPQEGEYTFLFQHDMRMDILPSIMDIGLTIVQNK